MIELILIADIWIVPSSSVLFLQVDMVQPAKSSSSSMFQLCTFWIPPWWWDYLPACFQHASGMCCRLTLISFRSNAGIFGIVTVYPKRINQKYTKNVYITGYLLGSLHPLFFSGFWKKRGHPPQQLQCWALAYPAPREGTIFMPNIWPQLRKIWQKNQQNTHNKVGTKMEKTDKFSSFQGPIIHLFFFLQESENLHVPLFRHFFSEKKTTLFSSF